MKKRILAILLPALLVVNISSCNFGSQSEIEEPFENIDTTGSNFEETDEKITGIEANAETVDIEGEFDPATNMRYTLIDGGKSYSVCPEGLPDVIKELVIPGEYKGLPVTELHGKSLADSSIETIIISEGIKEISMGFDYCRDIKSIYIPASVIYIREGAFNCRATMGGHGFIKSNVIEKSSKKIILGCNSSVIPNDGSVKSIGYAAFANCQSIETIILPKSIIEIESAAFTNCDNLKQVYITSSASKDKKIVNFNPEAVLGYDSGHIFHVPDAESAEIYSKVFGPYFEIGTDIEKLEATVSKEEQLENEYQEMVGCSVKTESGEKLKYLMEKDKDKIKVEHENYGSNTFYITSFVGNSEYQTTIMLSEGIRTSDIYAGFTSDQHGYVMIFHMEGYSVSPMDDIELACILKTADGGKTWEKREYKDFKVSNGREYISAACFFTDDVGFFTARYTNTDHFAPRTYWTVDGGKTWTQMPRMDIPNVLKRWGIQGADFSTEISDVTITGDMYTITVRICHGYSLEIDGKQNSEIYIQYQSEDLINWTLM